MKSIRQYNNKILFLLVVGIGFVGMGVLYRNHFPKGSRFLASSRSRTGKKFSSMNCDMEKCINYNRCPIAKKFSVYIYPTIYSLHNQLGSPANNSATPLLAHLHRTISKNHQITKNPEEACVFIVLVDSCKSHTIQNKSHVWGLGTKNSVFTLRHFDKKNLQFWTPDGMNHIIWLADGSSRTRGPRNRIDLQTAPNFRVHNSRFGRAMVISETFWKSNFRPHFDFVVSHLNIGDDAQSEPSPRPGPGKRIKTASTDILRQPALPLFPTRRKYLATYFPDESDPPFEEMKLLHKMSRDKPTLFKFSTYFFDSKNSTPAANASQGQGLPSQSNIVHRDLLLNSTFSLVMLHRKRAFGVTGNNSGSRTTQSNEFILTAKELQRKLYMVLSSGAIPVVIGSQFLFPFSEFIDWSQIAVTLPWGRLKELSQILEAIPDSDIGKFRKNGRRVFVKYLSSIENVVETLLAGVRTRIGIPPAPYDAVLSLSAYPLNVSKPVDKTFDFNVEIRKVQNASRNWSLATVVENSFPSPNFIRNVSSSLFLDKYSLWNVHYQPFRLFPSTPWDISVPAEAQVKVSATLRNKTVVKRVRPAYGGGGRNTTLFRTSLGGNIPPEQFTIVVLTFKREKILMKLLKMFVGLSYLRSVLVVWNRPDYPLKNLTWPEIGVPVHVIKSRKNSLNNRFIPYKEIETEAVLSMDDDSVMSHEEIMFTFRVWRENRERIVGLPGRFHEWNALSSAWTYGAYSSCELSMVLTGAAFYHKYYAYMYTFEMPAAIRTEVDRVTNCEDIAINFLIAHLTQKPPIKVTGRDEFYCLKCKKSLSTTGPYYHRRHGCMNAFTKVYGYMPLLYTQFRANSLKFGSSSNSRCFNKV